MTASEQMIAKYGLPDGHYQAKFCFVWEIQQDFPWYPVSRIFINKDFRDMLFASFLAVQVRGLQGEIKKYNGCLVVRNVRGRNSYSAHAWGAAIDQNAQDDPMVIKPVGQITAQDRLGKWSQGFVDAMTSSGVFFGGNFKLRPDPMHFSMLDM
jgi:D-alanyl-D-alanine carboxypeptidase-like protein